MITGCPVGLGEPVFDRLHADLGKSMLSINAVKGFEYGSGFEGVKLRGSEHNDAYVMEKGKMRTRTNHSGGIQGGISNGMDIYFRVAFKPVATIMRPQMSADKKGKAVEVQGRGRHDPCVVPRAVPIVEAMAAITVADHHGMAGWTIYEGWKQRGRPWMTLLRGDVLLNQGRLEQKPGYGKFLARGPSRPPVAGPVR